MKAIIAGIILGAATLAYASHAPVVKQHNAGWPIPLCPPDQPNCTF
jgi:hypothetical protein